MAGGRAPYVASKSSTIRSFGIRYIAMRTLSVVRFERLRPLLVLLALSLTALPEAPAAAAQQVVPSAFSGMRWRSIGPYRSGYVYAVAGVPGDPAVYYLGLPEGGVWKSTSGGTVWKPIFDDVHVPSIGSVVVAYSDPEVVYVGTGDPTGWSYTSGNGVYKSTDAGKSWTRVGLEGSRYIPAMLVNPNDENDVLAGVLGFRQRAGGPTSNAETGIYRSTDGGATWKRVLHIDPHTGVTGLSRDERDPTVMYASFRRNHAGLSAMQERALKPLGSGIFKSTDGGATWSPIPGKGLPEAARGFEIAVASGTGGMRLYAEAQGAGRDAKGVYRSDDGGETWTLGTHHIASAGGRIYVNPTNPDVVYLMGTSMYRSVDGGHTFRSFKGSPGGDDERDLWIDPQNGNRMLLGADQGPAVSLDGGHTWTPWYNLPNGQFYNVSTDQHFPYRVCGSQQDSGSACVLSRSDWGQILQSDWSPAGGFEAGYIVTDPLNPRWVYVQGWYHVLRRMDRETGQVAVLYSPTPRDRFLWSPPMVFSPRDPHTLYMGAQWILASSDGARTWRHVSPDLTTSSNHTRRDGSSGASTAPASVQTIAPSPVADGQIWAGTSNGLIQLTRDGGARWTEVTPPDMPRGAINIIEASHRDAGTAYAAVQVPGDDSPWIFRTHDFGRSWQKIVAGLPTDAGARVVREDPVDPNLLYAGTVKGAWVSFDRGDHWQSLQLNLPTTPVTDMTIHGSDLDISTYGRGLWILDDVTPLRQIHEAVASTDPYLFRPDTAWRVRWDNYQDTPLPPEVPAGQNPPEGAIVDYYLPTDAVGPVTLSFFDGSGELVRRYTDQVPPPDTVMANVPSYWIASPVVLSTKAGMHRIAWDMRWETPPALNYSYGGDLLDYTEFTLTWHAIAGHTPRWVPTGPLVVPGTYRVELRIGDRSYTRQLTIRNDPRGSVSQEGLEAQLAFERRMMAGMKASYDGFNQIQTLRDTLAADLDRAGTGQQVADLVAAARALDRQAEQTANGSEDSFGPANRDLARHLEDMEFGDLRPTDSDVAAAEVSCRQIDAASAALAELRKTAIPRLNAMLLAAHLVPLPAIEVPASPACRIGS